MPRWNYETLEERFWSKVDKTGECWIWIAGKSSKGYGKFQAATGQDRYAHRVAWELAHGPIQDGLFVCHHCDNPLCVNPDHLFLGTHTDNMRDMVRKGRAAPKRGEDSRFAVLTEEQVKEIRSIYKKGETTYTEIGARFGCSRNEVRHIVLRTRWKHVDAA